MTFVLALVALSISMKLTLVFTHNVVADGFDHMPRKAAESATWAVVCFMVFMCSSFELARQTTGLHSSNAGIIILCAGTTTFVLAAVLMSVCTRKAVIYGLDRDASMTALTQRVP